MVHAALRETADHTRYLGAKTDTPFVRLRPVGKPPGHALLRSLSIGIVTCCIPTASAMLSPRGCGRPSTWTEGFACVQQRVRSSFRCGRNHEGLAPPLSAATGFRQRSK